MKESHNGHVLICLKCSKLYPDWIEGIFCEECGGNFVEVEANPIAIRDMIRAIRAKNEPTTYAG